MALSNEEIERIAVRVSELIRSKQTDDKFMSMKEAAEFMKIRAKDSTLPAIFSKYASIRYTKYPLTTYKIGRARTYKKEDLEKFMRENGKRN